MIIPSWDDDPSYIHDLIPVVVESCTVFEQDFHDDVDTGLLDKHGKPIRRKLESPKGKLGF